MIDFNLEPGEPTINDDASLVIQQINILFDSTPGDLIGNISFGTRYDKFLYELKLSADQLKEEVLNDLHNIDLRGFTPDVEVYLLQGSERDIAVIEINLLKRNSRYTTTYKIQ